MHPRTVIREIRFFRLGNGTNIELFDYDAADGQTPQPRNSDIGGHHLALYVDDLDAAVAYLRAHDVEIMGEPVASAGAVGGSALALLPQPVGNAVRARQLPRRQGVRSIDAAVKLLAPGAPGRMSMA